jgi:hypothetical protein
VSKKEPIEPDVVAKALLEARDLMNDSGAHWTKGHFRWTNRKTRETKFCSVGAIREVSKKQPELRREMLHALWSVLPTPYQFRKTRQTAVLTWNDSASRSWSDISQTFKKAAARLLKEKKA